MRRLMLSACHRSCQVPATGGQACQDLESSVWMKNEEKGSAACAVDRWWSEGSVP